MVKSIIQLIPLITITTANHINQDHLARIARYDRICRHNRTTPIHLTDQKDITASSLSQIFYDDSFKLVLCTVPKAGTTNWQRVLSTLKSNFSTKPEDWRGQKIYKQANRLSKYLPDSDDVTRYELQKKVNDEDFLKVISVRHPLTRLLSAWRDKFALVDGSQYWHKKYGNYINEKYSQPDEPADPKHYVTWLSFLRYIAAEPEQYFDYHWRSFWKFCKPCSIRYDFIVKSETSEQDAREVFKHLRINDKIHLPKRYKNSLSPSKYYENIPDDLLQQIYEKYRMDFELFGYSLDKIY